MNIKKTNTQVLSNESNFGLNLTSFDLSVEGSATIAERYIDLFAKNRIPSAFLSSKDYGWIDFQRDLQFLSRKMEAVRKTLSIWESYRIGEVASNRDELEYKIGALPPNTGLVVNFEADNLQIGDQSYSQGDVVFSDYLGNQHILKSFSGGFYYPHKYTTVGETEGVYQIFYHYATSQPAEGEEELVENAVLETPVKDIALNFHAADTEDRYNYSGIVAPGQSVTLTPRYSQDQLVYPIVNWFLVTEQFIKEDRISWDVEWEFDSENELIILTNDSIFNCWCEVR